MPQQVGRVGVFVDPDDALLDRAVAAGYAAAEAALVDADGLDGRL